MSKAYSFIFLMIFSSSLFAQESFVEIKDRSFARKNITRLHQGLNEIILTFDDGPTPLVTDKVLDILGKHNIKATFFVLGSKAKANPLIMKRIFDEGHIVANHSLTHPNLTETQFTSSNETLRKEVFGAHAIIVPYMANAKHFYFRAPGGAWKNSLAEYLNTDPIGEQYVGPIFWDIGGDLIQEKGKWIKTADWACWSKKLSIKDCLSGYINEAKETKGGVVLMHDLRTQSAELLDQMIPTLIDSGYSFKTLDDIDWDSRL
jgi:peptidoglycan/xylan/chitin deacetylase (PgdA/CDA1 family)